MLSTTNIKDWIKIVNNNLNLGFENFYVGKLDETKQKAICVYNLKESNPYVGMYLGGAAGQHDNSLYISLLIHYTKSYSETENVSSILFDFLKKQITIDIGTYRINWISALSGNEDVATDKNGIYERVMQFEINYII